MQSEQVKMRFGRCPYCRAMIYQDPKAVIYYCSKCRTPIRGKSPEPADDTEYALAQLEILSFDTMSVFSDELEPSSADFDPSSRETGAATSTLPYRAFNSVRTGRRSGDLSGPDRSEEPTEAGRSGSPLHNRVRELRPASRRTRRPLSADLDARRDEGSSSGSEVDVPRTRSASCYRRRASPMSSQELGASMDLSGHDRPAAGVAKSPLTDPAFQQDLLQALENLRKLIVAVEEPYRADGQRDAAVTAPRASVPGNDSGARTVTRRDSRLLRRLESKLSQALPSDGPHQDATTSSSSSSSASTSSRRGAERRGASRQLCRPILGGTPFVVCDKCSEILQLPAALSADRFARLQCGGCGEVLALTLPANAGATDRPRKFFSAPRPAAVFGADDAGEYVPARSRLSGEQLRQGPDEGPLHRVLGYSSVSSVLRSRRYEEHS